MANTTRYLLCRPCHGFNDMLCVLQRCWVYAERYDRDLIIDTFCQRARFLDNLDNYFVLKKPHINVHFQLTPNLLKVINKLAVYPKHVTNKLNTYKTVRLPRRRGHYESNTLKPVTFSFAQDYNEQLLVYDWGIGGTSSVSFFKRVKFNDKVGNIIKSRLRKLPEDYVAIHVRHTDIRQDYKSFFAKIRDAVKGKDVLMCSDNRECIDYAKKFFTGSNIITITDTPDVGGEPLHKTTKYAKFNLNTDMLTDLVGMVKSNKIYYTHMVGKRRGKISGFLRLAAKLQQRPALINEALG